MSASKVLSIMRCYTCPFGSGIGQYHEAAPRCDIGSVAQSARLIDITMKQMLDGPPPQWCPLREKPRTILVALSSVKRFR